MTDGSGSGGAPRFIPRKMFQLSGYDFETPIRYAAEELLGRGAYGVVCSALDSVLLAENMAKYKLSQSRDKGIEPEFESEEEVRERSMIAIKKIGNIFGDAVNGKRNLRELKLLGFMSHPNVLGLRDVYRPRQYTAIVNSPALRFAEPGTLPNIHTASDFFADVYVVTDLMTTDLGKIFAQQGASIAEEHATWIVYQMCLGLNYIHAAGVLHRDIKPGNMLISEDGQLKIADFGLARCDNGENLTDYVATRWYRPPELLLASDTYTHAVDMWGVGCIAAECLRRKTLLPGTDYINQVTQIIDLLGTPTEPELRDVRSEEGVAFIRSLPPRNKTNLAEVIGGGCSPAMVSFVERCICFDPKKRLTAREALQHPWLSEHYDPADLELLPTGGAKFRWEHDSKDISLELLKALTKEEVDNRTSEEWRSVVTYYETSTSVDETK